MPRTTSWSLACRTVRNFHSSSTCSDLAHSSKAHLLVVRWVLAPLSDPHALRDAGPDRGSWPRRASRACHASARALRTGSGAAAYSRDDFHGSTLTTQALSSSVALFRSSIAYLFFFMRDLLIEETSRRRPPNMPAICGRHPPYVMAPLFDHLMGSQSTISSHLGDINKELARVSLDTFWNALRAKIIARSR